MAKISPRVWAEISRSALQHNISLIKERADAYQAELIGVVKANAYGHGDVLTAEILEDAGAAALAVAIPEEGAALRKAGIELPIMILGAVLPEDYPLVVKNNLTPTLFSLDDAVRFASYVEGKKQAPYEVQLKIDTGMSRIGLLCTEEGVREAIEMCHIPALNFVGAFTHFARADETDKSSAIKQEKRFTEFQTALEQANVRIPLWHSANSAALMELPQAFKGCKRAVRAGIILYGLYPSEEVNRALLPLQPVLSLYATVTQVKTVDKGESIGYGGTYTLTEKRRIATIPVGYADGYPRELSNKGFVVIGGTRCPIVGRICMDQLMVDVTELAEDEVNTGTKAMLYGADFTVEEAAKLAGTIHYELCCRLSTRVPKIIVD